jgi:hypothetical protein
MVTAGRRRWRTSIPTSQENFMPGDFHGPWNWELPAVSQSVTGQGFTSPAILATTHAAEEC